MPQPDASLYVSAFNEGTAYLNTLWQFFSVTSLAVIGYVWARRREAGGRAKLALAIGFAIVTIGLHFDIQRALRVVDAAAVSSHVAAETPNMPKATQMLLHALPRPQIVRVRAFHGVLSAVVLLGIYLAHRRDRKPIAA